MEAKGELDLPVAETPRSEVEANRAEIPAISYEDLLPALRPLAQLGKVPAEALPQMLARLESARTGGRSSTSRSGRSLS